jgi:hypothetical protein
MTVKINGTNTAAAPGYAGDDADTGLQCATNELSLVTGGTARATVNSAGNVGVGGAAVPTSTVYDTATLHLRQAGSTGSQFRLTTATSGHTSSDGAHISFWNDNHLYVFNKETAGHVVLGAGNDTRARITTDGLCFGNDTAAVNALSDYEEGTFTPKWGSSTPYTSPSPTYTGQQGNYTKIGRVVYFDIRIATSAWNSAGSSLWMHGLPYVGGFGASVYQVAMCGYFMITGVDSTVAHYSLSGQLQGGEDYFQIYYSSSGSGNNFTSFSTSDINEGSNVVMRMNGFYFT